MTAPTSDDRWLARARELKTFTDTTGRMPTVSGYRPREKQMTYWVENQLRRHRAGKLPEHRTQVLRSLHPDLAELMNPEHRDTRWNQSLTDLTAFIESTHRLPLASNTAEATLAAWLAHQQYKANHNTLAAERLAALQQSHPMIAERLAAPGRTPWHTQLAAVNHFIEQAGRLPGKGSADEELKLYRWVERQVTAHRSGRHTAEQMTDLATAHHLFVERLTRKHRGDSWDDRLNELNNFVTARRRLPGKSAAEQTLLRFVEKTASSHNCGKLSPARTAQVAAAHPLVRARILKAPAATLPQPVSTPAPRVRVAWDDRIAQLREHLDDTGKLPVRSGEPSEHQLARWLNTVVARHNRDGLPAGQLAELTDLHPLLAERLNGKTLAEIWDEKLDELRQFITSAGRLPLRTSSEALELSLASWLGTQVKSSNTGTLPAARRARLQWAHPLIRERLEHGGHASRTATAA